MVLLVVLETPFAGRGALPTLILNRQRGIFPLLAGSIHTPMVLAGALPHCFPQNLSLVVGLSGYCGIPFQLGEVPIFC